jgi:hypothetical protein
MKRLCIIAVLAFAAPALAQEAPTAPQTSQQASKSERPKPVPVPIIVPTLPPTGY